MVIEHGQVMHNRKQHYTGLFARRNQWCTVNSHKMGSFWLITKLKEKNTARHSINSGWLPWQQGSVRGKFEGHRSIGRPRKPPFWSKQCALILKGGWII